MQCLGPPSVTPWRFLGCTSMRNLPLRSPDEAIVKLQLHSELYHRWPATCTRNLTERCIVDRPACRIPLIAERLGIHAPPVLVVGMCIGLHSQITESS
jgi:hypothetical protein